MNFMEIGSSGMTMPSLGVRRISMACQLWWSHNKKGETHKKI